MEITIHDLSALRGVMEQLAALSVLSGVETVEIHTTIEGQKFVVGYGESGEPAILRAEYSEA